MKVTGDVVSIPLENIRAYSAQPREEFAQDRIEALAESIREHGQQTPVKVREVKTTSEERKFELIDGERRFRALKHLHRTEIIAIVDLVGDDNDHFLKAVVANSAREDLSPTEVARAVARVAAMPGFVECNSHAALCVKLAKVFGHTAAWVEGRLKIDSLAPQTQTLLEQGELSVEAAIELAAIKKPERQAEIGQRVASGHLRNNAAKNVIRQAVRVEEERDNVAEPAGSKMAEGILNKRSTDLVNSLVSRIHETAECLLDMPARRLSEAYKSRPVDCDLARGRIQNAMNVLSQLHNALDKLARQDA